MQIYILKMYTKNDINHGILVLKGVPEGQDEGRGSVVRKIDLSQLTSL